MTLIGIGRLTVLRTVQACDQVPGHSPILLQACQHLGTVPFPCEHMTRHLGTVPFPCEHMTRHLGTVPASTSGK